MVSQCFQGQVRLALSLSQSARCLQFPFRIPSLTMSVLCWPFSTYPWQKSVTSGPDTAKILEAILVTLYLPFRGALSLPTLSPFLFSHAFLYFSCLFFIFHNYARSCPQHPYIIAWTHWWAVSKMGYRLMLVLYTLILFSF